jgi:hypothetical protein
MADPNPLVHASAIGSEPRHVGPKSVPNAPENQDPRKMARKRIAKTSRKPLDDPPADTRAYLADWAVELARTLPRGELRRLAAMYGRNARNGRLGATDRAFARRREMAIRRLNRCK